MDQSPSRWRLAALSLGLAALGWLASCAQAPGSSAAPGPSVVPAPVQTSEASAPPTPAPAPPPAVIEGPVPGSPAAIQASQRAATTAVELLEVGHEEQAAEELRRALLADPTNKLAQSLLKQIQTDPQTLLGREHFSYRVQGGESLSRIAQRFLGDVHLFYALARYNDIKVPRQLQEGQTIRVPGKAPPVPAAPAPVAQPATSMAKPSPPAASAAVDPRTAERERRAKIAAAIKAARSAFARQDLDGAIRHWDVVLELDPGNATAQLERKKAADLKAKLEKVK